MSKKITILFLLFLLNSFLIFGSEEDYSALVKFNLYHYTIDQQNEEIDINNFQRIGYLAEPYNNEIMWEIEPVLTNSLELVRLDDDTLTYEYDNTIPYILGFKNSWDDNNPLLFDSNNQLVVTPNNINNDRRIIDIKVTNSYIEDNYEAGRYLTMFYIKAFFVDSNGNKTTEEPLAQALLEYAVEIRKDNSPYNADSSDNTAYIHITPEQLASSINLTSLYSSLNNFLKVGTIEYLQTRSKSWGNADALDVNLIISPVPNIQSLDGSTFKFTKTDSSSYQIPYKVAVAKNGTYHENTFILENVGDLINWQDAPHDSENGNFKQALIPLYIKGKDSIIQSNQILEAGNYTSTIFVNVINPN